MEYKGGLLGNRPKAIGLLGSHPKPVRINENGKYDKIHSFSKPHIQRNRLSVPKPPLLPQPVAPKVRFPTRKQPLLRTPLISEPQRHLHHKPLLETPQYSQDEESSSFREQQPSDRKPANKIQKMDMYGKHKGQKIYFRDHSEKNNARNTQHDQGRKKCDAKSEMDAYQLHLKKLQKSTTTLNFFPVHQQSNKSNFVVIENKDERGDLSCLASYLLQIKSFSSNSDMEDKSVGKKGTHNNPVDTGDSNQPQKSDIDVRDNNISDKNCVKLCTDGAKNETKHEVSISQTLVQDNSLHASVEESSSPVAETSTQSCSIATTGVTEVVSKTKKHKIQLSNYASGNSLFEASDRDAEKRKRLDSSDGLLQVKISKSTEKTSLFTKDVFDDVLPIAETEFHKTIVEQRCDAKPFIPLKGPSSESDVKPFIPLKGPSSESDASVAELESVLPRGSSALGRSVESEKVGEELAVARPRSLLFNQATHDKVEKQIKGAAVEDLPHIIPVSGYFCDLCCDFFFDSESTFQHCSSQDHVEKSKASRKLESASNTSPANRANLSVNSDEENVVHRKKKEKQQSVRKSAFLHPRIAPHKNARKSTRPATRNSSAPKEKKPFNWNFVIPKRK